MSILLFILSLVLLVAGAASGYQSLDLLPTGVGVLYALAGATAASAGIIVFAIALLIRRINALARLMKETARPPVDAVPAEAAAKLAEAALEAPRPRPPAALETGFPKASVESPSAEAEEDEAPINENRAGHLPSLTAIEHALETPDPPSLIGRYSAGGANYMIFSDGSIEAETKEGLFKFASMGEFKRFVSERKAESVSERKPEGGKAREPAPAIENRDASAT